MTIPAAIAIAIAHGSAHLSRKDRLPGAICAFIFDMSYQLKLVVVVETIYGRHKGLDFVQELRQLARITAIEVLHQLQTAKDLIVFVHELGIHSGLISRRTTITSSKEGGLL